MIVLLCILISFICIYSKLAKLPQPRTPLQNNKPKDDKETVHKDDSGLGDADDNNSGLSEFDNANNSDGDVSKPDVDASTESVKKLVRKSEGKKKRFVCLSLRFALLLTI